MNDVVLVLEESPSNRVLPPLLVGGGLNLFWRSAARTALDQEEEMRVGLERKFEELERDLQLAWSARLPGKPNRAFRRAGPTGARRPRGG